MPATVNSRGGSRRILSPSHLGLPHEFEDTLGYMGEPTFKTKSINTPLTARSFLGSPVAIRAFHDKVHQSYLLGATSVGAGKMVAY